MPSSDDLIRGLHRTAELIPSLGSTAAIRDAVASGSLIKIKNGWYADPTAHPAALSAVRQGGRISCLSALAHHGVWVPPQPILHVRGVPGGCPAPRHTPRGRDPIDPLPLALDCAVRCADNETLVAVCDSILYQGLLHRADVRASLRALPARRQHLVEVISPKAESGNESLVRYRFHQVGVRCEPQVEIPGVGRVDHLVGERWIIECDSREHHTDLRAYQKDRTRDQRAIALGYLHTRLTWEDVVFRWDAVWPDLRAVLRQRLHLRELPATTTPPQLRSA